MTARSARHDGSSQAASESRYSSIMMPGRHGFKFGPAPRPGSHWHGQRPQAQPASLSDSEPHWQARAESEAQALMAA
eukprot:3881566-Rhodomonas_salina.3